MTMSRDAPHLTICFTLNDHKIPASHPQFMELLALEEKHSKWPGAQRWILRSRHGTEHRGHPVLPAAAAPTWIPAGLLNIGLCSKLRSCLGSTPTDCWIS